MNNDQQKQPLVSIITPVLNQERFLEKLILSIKSQDYNNIQHIVVDGGSTDKTLDILKKYEGTYNLVWSSEKDKGIADAYNKGFAKATGEIFCWQDADDWYLPGTIKKVVEVFNNHPAVDFVFGDILFCDKNDNIVDYTKRPGFDGESLVYNMMNINPQTAFWKSSLHKKLQGLDIRYRISADYDFYIRALRLGAKFYHIPEFLAAYRYHPQQITKNVELLRLEHSQIQKKYFDKNITPIQLTWKKRKILLRKTWYFIKKGDFAYIFRSILRRLNILHPYYTFE